MGKKLINRIRLVKYLDDYLQIASIADDSQNGLQVEGSARINKLAFAVDACLQTIKAAARFKADMLIVHHGLLWSRRERITGIMQQRINWLLKHNISLYAAHLPLDCHEEVGNNVELARILGLEFKARFAKYHGIEIGIIAEAPRRTSRDRIMRMLEQSLNTKASLLAFGPEIVKRAGIVSGDADFAALEASDKGCDTFITGETSHVAFHLAKESRMNVVYAGHYASETVGLKALEKHLRKTFSVKCKFISAPTGF
jgi:dinuclear metal center YbgI/SA1388 family protein